MKFSLLAISRAFQLLIISKRGWLPHFNLAVVRKLAEGSADHAVLLDSIQKPGTLTVNGKVNLVEMLQPAVQPGAKLDYERAVEKVSVTFEGDRGFSVTNLPVGTAIDPLGTAGGL